ncbi:unnamed protein product, partial [Mesorhabditis spiculigera]
MSRIIHLSSRALLTLRGPDSVSLLQNLVTNDMRRLGDQKVMASFLLNEKGRIVEDLLIYRHDDGALVECSAKNQKDFKKLLEKYRLRKQVEIEDSPDSVYYTSEPTKTPDPRTPALGYRLLGKHESDGKLDEYKALRYSVGVAEGKSELGDLLPFHANGDVLHCVSLEKGCYIGQELTARTAHTGVIRRRIIPFTCNEEAAPRGEVFDSEKRKVGETIASVGGHGLALIQLNSTGRKLFVGETSIVPFCPAWMPPKLYSAAPSPK